MLVVGALIISVPNAILRGFAIATLWRWFVQDVFPSAPDLGIVNAIGLTYVVMAMTMVMPPDDDLELGESLIRGQVFVFIASLLALLFGWFWVQFQ